jgi:hypothetical protein
MLRYTALLLPLSALLVGSLACGSTPNPSEPDPPTQDAGPDVRPPPFPDDLPQCTDAPETLSPSAPLLAVVPDEKHFPMGWGVRDNVALAGANGRLSLPTKTFFNGEISNQAYFSNDAFHTLDYQYTDMYQPRAGYGWASSVGAANAARVIKGYVEASKADVARQVFWRLSVYRSFTQLQAFEYSPAPDAEPVVAGDRYIYTTSALQLFDSYLSFQFVSDSACHIRALSMIVGRRDFDPEDRALSVKDLLRAEVRPTVERYLKERAPKATAYRGTLATNFSLDGLKEANEKGCDLSDLSGCAAYMAKVEATASAFGDTGKAPIKESDFDREGKLPTGFIQGAILTEAVPRP